MPEALEIKLDDVQLFKKLFSDSLQGYQDRDVKYERDEKYVIRNTEITIAIEGYISPFIDQEYSYNKFTCFLFKSSFQNQNQITTIVYKADDDQEKTLGYIYPRTALLRDNTIEEKYKSLFACAAIENVILNGFSNHLVIPYSSPAPSSAQIDITFESLFNEDVSIAVIGKEQLLESKLTTEELVIQICKHGYENITNPLEISYELSVEFRNSIKIKKLPDAAKMNAKIFVSLLRIYATQNDPLSKFMVLYQIIEIFIAEIFSAELSILIEQEENVKNAWKMKEKLQDLSTEMKRINHLFNSYTQGKDSAIFSYCEDLCRAFTGKYLLDIEALPLDQKELPVLIYKIRNHIVHYQPILIERAEKDLNDICEAFKRCCIELIIFFKIPKRPDLPPEVIAENI
ncbi:MAG: hypothetical protein K8S20_11870 [Chloroflexi bacterium]|nr:hypothetical protein [Chloroflexota bacterium]